jgi:hypothetical protein
MLTSTVSAISTLHLDNQLQSTVEQLPSKTIEYRVECQPVNCYWGIQHGVVAITQQKCTH